MLEAGEVDGVGVLLQDGGLVGKRKVFLRWGRWRMEQAVGEIGVIEGEDGELIDLGDLTEREVGDSVVSV